MANPSTVTNGILPILHRSDPQPWANNMRRHHLSSEWDRVFVLKDSVVSQCQTGHVQGQELGNLRTHELTNAVGHNRRRAHDHLYTAPNCTAPQRTAPHRTALSPSQVKVKAKANAKVEEKVKVKVKVEVKVKAKVKQDVQAAAKGLGASSYGSRTR